MSDLQVGEAFEDRVFLVETATGNPHLLQTPTCTIVDESGNRAAGVVAEQSDGWYTCSFTPDAAGTWATEWSNAGSTIYFGMKIFKVGGGEIADIKADTAAILTDTSTTLDNLVDDLETRCTEARLAELDAANLPTDVSTIDGFHDVPAQNSADNAQMRDVVGQKTDTTAGNSIIALLKQIVEDTGTTLDDLVDGIEARTNNHVNTRTWFSDIQEEVQLTNAAGDKALPSVVLPNITGTIVAVYAGFKFRMVENTNAAANKLNGAQDIQVKESAAGAYTDAINFVDDAFGLAATTREGGDCIVGDIDVSAEVAAFNKTYNFQWDEAVADQSNLQFNDVQTFLIVSYY